MVLAHRQTKSDLAKLSKPIDASSGQGKNSNTSNLFGGFDSIVQEFQGYLGKNGLALPEIKAVTTAEMDKIRPGSKALITSESGKVVIYLDLEKHHNAKDVMRSLKHEAIAHYGWRHAISKKDRDGILKLIINSRDTELQDEWNQITSKYSAYAKRPIKEQAEEVLALVAESLDLSKPALGKKLANFIMGLLRRLGLAPARITRNEIQDMLRAIAQGHVATRTPEADIVAELARGFQRAEGSKPIPTRVWDKAKRVWTNRGEAFPLIKFFATADRRLRQISTELADLFNEQVQGRTDNRPRGYLQAKSNVTNLWVGEWKRAMKELEKTYSAEQIKEGINILRAAGPETKITDPVALRTKKFLDAFYKNYANNKEFNPMLGNVKNYFPRMYDLEMIREKPEEFIRILEANGYDNPQGIMDKILSNGDGFTGDNIDSVSKASAPTANARLGRTLNWMLR